MLITPRQIVQETSEERANNHADHNDHQGETGNHRIGGAAEIVASNSVDQRAAHTPGDAVNGGEERGLEARGGEGEKLQRYGVHPHADDHH